MGVPEQVTKLTELDRVHADENLDKKHETRYFQKPHLYKNIAIYLICSSKNLEYFFLRERDFIVL